MRNFKADIPINPKTISLGYILLASLWILISNYVAINVIDIPMNASMVHNLKGVSFVLVTGGFLYLLMVKHREKFVDKNKEIEALSQEVHHRVKNNLALVTSLLELERENRELDSEYDELLKDTNFKIRTISVTHELLYQQNAFSRIDLDRFLKEFNSRLIEELVGDDEVPIKLQFDNKEKVKVDIKYAIPIALFLYECVLYAKRDEVAPISKLFVDLYKTDSNLYLSCHFRSDRKVPTIELESPKLLELQLTCALLDQLDSYWKVEYDESEAVIYVDIPMPENEKSE